MRSITLSARVPYFLFGPFVTDWDNFSDFIPLLPQSFDEQQQKSELL